MGIERLVRRWNGGWRAEQGDHEMACVRVSCSRFARKWELDQVNAFTRVNKRLTTSRQQSTIDKQATVDNGQQLQQYFLFEAEQRGSELVAAKSSGEQRSEVELQRLQQSDIGNCELFARMLSVSYHATFWGITEL